MDKNKQLTAIATSLGTTLKDLQTNMQKATILEVNEFSNSLLNLIGKQMITNMFNFKNPYTSLFAKDAFQYGDGAQALEVQITEDSEDYDPNAINPTSLKQQEILESIITTKDRKLFETSINSSIFKGAFVSDIAFNGVIGQIMGVLEKKLELFLFKTLTTHINTGIKNVKTLKSGTILANWKELIKDSNQMKLPTKKFNLGFVDPEDASVSDQVQINTSELSDLVLIMNTNTQSDLKLDALPSLFHIDEFNINEKYGGIILANLADNEVIALDKRAFLFFWRINELGSQAYLKPMKIYIALHAWMRYGLVPWANGRKYTLTIA